MKAASEFKQFLLRGNVVDLAIAFVIGAYPGNALCRDACRGSMIA